MTTPIAWILVLISVGSVSALVYLLLQRLKPSEVDLPGKWSLTARPVFNQHERRLIRQLREALPQQVILAKLPLVRFCHPTDPTQVRFWFDLLGATHVSFAVCTTGGRVLAAIDLEDGRSPARRSMQIKESLFAACGIRYVRYSVTQTPSVPELQLLVPASADVAPSPASGAVMNAGFGPASSPTIWPDSDFPKDSSFGRDGVISGFHRTIAASLPERSGEVVDPPPLRH